MDWGRRSHVERRRQDRRAAFDDASDALAIDGLELREIRNEDLDDAEQWPAAWPWRETVENYRKRHPGRVDVAMRRYGRLCALALGKDSKTAARIAIVESDPDPEHPLKGDVALLAVTVANAYAAVRGFGEVHIIEPSDGLVSYYELLGFAMAEPAKGEKPFMRRPVGL